MNKLIAPLALMLTLLVTGLGCASKKAAVEADSPMINDAVTDVDVAPMPPQEPEMAYSDAAVPAPAPAAEAPVVTEAPAAAESAPASTYTVKKGDTLFSIAHEVYGNGGQWQRIAGANPGLSPSTLKAGTTIAIP